MWKQPKCPSMDEWIKKMWNVYTMEYYSAMRKKEILSFATTWMDLEGMMLSEISQRRTITAWYHLYVKSKRKKPNSWKQRVEKWLPGAGKAGMGENRERLVKRV